MPKVKPLEQPWFEMEDLSRPRIPTASWISLRASEVNRKGEYWKPGCVDEYFGANSVLLPADHSDHALQISWNDVGNQTQRSWVEGEDYIPAGIFKDYQTDLVGSFPVLEQYRDGDHTTEWYLDQDIVFALGLKLEEDSWVCPGEDFIQVARLRRGDDGRPELFEIRAEHLRDYLCARKSRLLVATYRSRRAVFDENPSITWESSNPKKELGGGQWEGSIRDIDETSSPYGSEWTVLTMSRKDPELEDDVPALNLPRNNEVQSESHTFQRGGPRGVMVSGQLWRNEWVKPAAQSPRVRGDKIESTVRFTIENDGATAMGSELDAGIRWLWFRPNIILDILRRRGGHLGWYSENTGVVGLASHSGLHFGMNELGLVNVFAKDIGLLPDRAQRIWASHNVTPEGGVSRELLASQMEVNPADTSAPEIEFQEAMAFLERESIEKFGRPLLQPHPKVDEIIGNIHRFQCVEPGGIFRLCKEVTRIITDRADIGRLRQHQPARYKQWRSIKLLEGLMSHLGFDGREITAPLVGANALRIVDAHLPPPDFNYALNLLGVEADMNDVQRGKRIISSVMAALNKIAESIVSLGPT